MQPSRPPRTFLARLSVSARFLLVLAIGFSFQAGISIVSLVELRQSLLQDRTTEVKHLLETAYSTVAFYYGKTFINSKDALANPVVAYMVGRLIDVAKSPAKEGVTTYRIPKAHQSTPLDKIAYSRLFEPWGWAKCPEMADLKLAVNVSARQFQHPLFVEQVLAVV